jgi:hypothetical protein
MTDEQLAYEIARGIGETHVEGFYDSVSCSTAGDYPSMGVSQWEGIGGRGDDLLNTIEGGAQFAGRTYSDIRDSGEIDALKAVLDSASGREAQNKIIAYDCLLYYVPAVKEVLSNEKCMIYAGMWCPTSHIVVNKFLRRRANRFNLDDLDVLHELFRDAYYIAASVGDEYAEGYANRANATYKYVIGLGELV